MSFRIVPTSVLHRRPQGSGFYRSDNYCDAGGNTVRVVDVFVDELNLADLGFDGIAPAITGRPSYHPSVLLKLYIYGYLNRIQSSRRRERECRRNVELMWLPSLHWSPTGR